MTKKVEAIENDLLSFVAANTLPSVRQPGEMTLTEMLQERQDRGEESVGRQLLARIMDTGVSEGKIERRQIVSNGKRVNVYRMKG